MSELERLLRHCRDMADRDDTPARDATLWRQIAAEVDEYLHPMSGEDGLF